jgi:hypothetical protein
VIEFPGLGFAIECPPVGPCPGFGSESKCFRIMDIIIYFVETQPHPVFHRVDRTVAVS